MNEAMVVDDGADQLEGGPAGGGLGLRTVVFLVAGLLASLIGGAVVWGMAGEAAPTVASGASGCKVHPLRFTVTDDPAEFARQKRFEATLQDVPKPGFYDRVIDPVPALHAASHSFVVVFARGDVDGDGEAGLRALEAAAVKTKAPVIVSRRSQTPAMVALSRGYELTCAQGGGAQAAEVRRFAAQEYSSVADPVDTTGRGPAPDAPHEAPSPATDG